MHFFKSINMIVYSITEQIKICKSRFKMLMHVEKHQNQELKIHGSTVLK